jgi:uncharacterized membrane protein YbhN (UPF0104 family)
VARRRGVRATGTLVVTGLCLAYIVWKIDIGEALQILGDAEIGYVLGAAAIMIVTVGPLAWRWQRLLAARGVDDGLGWLTRAYFVSYTAGQVLPTALGGDAVRIFETTRRHPGYGGPIAGSVLLERALGGAATLALAAVGFVLAIGHYDVGAYLWIELAFVVGTVALGIALFSRRARGPLSWTVPVLRLARVERPARAVYEGIHGYRSHARLLVGVALLTLAIQAVRVLAIWLTGKAVGVGVRRQLPGTARRRRRRCLRGRFPLLPGHGRGCPAGCRDPRLAEPSPLRPGERRTWLTSRS